MILQTESVISVSKGGHMGNLNETPSANRLHIGIYGKTNSGKSSLINAVTKQEVSIVADVAGTTTDPVYKSMEIHPLGPCVIIDTAGFDDDSELGERRVEKTHLAAEKTDIAVVVLDIAEVIAAKKAGVPFKKAFKDEAEWSLLFAKKHTPVVFALNKIDEILLSTEAQEKSRGKLDNAAIEAAKCWVYEENSAVMGKNADNSLPQVQTLRELLDRKCLVMSTTTDKMTDALAALSHAPKLIVTDSQVFGYVYEHKPAESMLTSFSVLFAAYKGDLPYYVESARAIDALKPSSRVLIAECCTHAPLAEDIGRVKLPNLLRKRVGEELTVDITSGTDFPDSLSQYDLIIQCGACMFNRKYVLSRIDRARTQHVPMTNYGVAIAHLTGILDKVSMP